MKRKVKIVKQPTYGSGGLHTGDQANYGLYRGGGQLQDYLTGPEKATDQDVRVTYPEVPRDEASIEVERGEYIIPPDMSALYKVGGQKHSKGGTPVYAKGGEYVVSDYVTMPVGLQEMLGFEATSRKKKDNTIAALLSKKVDAKEYNRLSKIIQDDLSGKDVDKFELATARNRMPLYQEYVSKAALGGELSKAIQGKEFQIPAIAEPALQTIAITSRRDEVEKEPLAQARMGGMLDQYQVGNSVKVKPSELQSYLDKGYKPDPNRPGYYTLTTPGSTENIPGTMGSGKSIVITKRAPKNVSYEDVLANPALYQSFLKSSGWSQAPESEARGAWNTWWTTKERPIYTPGTSVKKPDVTSEIFVEGDPFGNNGPQLTSTTPPVLQYTPTTGGSSSSFKTEETPTGKTIQITGKSPEWQKSWTSGDQPWWAQNVLQTGLLAADWLNREDIYPWEPTVNLVAPQATFRSPRQAIAAVQSQAADARRAAAMFAGPQRFASVSQNIAAQTIPGVLQAEAGVNQANQAIANQMSQINADVSNKQALANAERALRLYDKTTMLRANRRAENRGKLSALINQGIIPGMKEAQRTSWMNAISKYYDIDPRTGKLYFTGGKDLDETAMSDNISSKVAGDIDIIRRLMKEAGLSAKEAAEYVSSMYGTKGGGKSSDALLKALGLG